MSYTGSRQPEFRELDLLALDFLYGQPGESGFKFATAGDDLAILGTGLGDSIAGSWLRDLIFGADGADSIDGHQANDMIFGGGGADKLLGGLGDDFLSSESGDSILNGEDGNDILVSKSGNSHLNGEDGDDLLIAINGNVILEGGAGADMIITGLGTAIVTGAYSVNDEFQEPGLRTFSSRLSTCLAKRHRWRSAILRSTTTTNGIRTSSM